MKKDAFNPSIWADQSSGYLTAIRRLGSDAAKAAKTGATPEAVRLAQDSNPTPQTP